MLVGRTNVGKSTLLNALVGTKVAIVTPRPQTTRDTYHGIVNHADGQIVFVDTPGIFKTQPSKLVQNLHHRVRDALEGIDLVVHVVDPSRSIGPEDRRTTEMVEHLAQPRVLVLNKLDLDPSRRPYRDQWLQQGEKYNAVVEVSAREHQNINLLVRAILRHLPEGSRQYPEGQLTNVTNEFWISELVREKIYLLTSQEVPYTTTVQVDEVEDRQDHSGRALVYIRARILTTDDRHQRMLIGKHGKRIREIGSAARKELEVAMNRKVYLDLSVTIDDQWLDRLR